MNFEELQLIPPILQARAQCGHISPAPVQAQAIPKALSGRNLIVSARTGTGKTAAFVLPALQGLSTKPSARKAGLEATKRPVLSKGVPLVSGRVRQNKMVVWR